jgi:hypothetical protein
MKTNLRRREHGRFPVQLAMAFAISAAVALLAGTLASQPQASAGVEFDPLHGISFTKGCVAPTIVGDPYRCNFQILNNVDEGPDALTITSLVDVVHASPSDVSSGNVLPTLSLGFTGGASCNVAQTLCTLPPGSKIQTTASLAFYTTDTNDPNPLTDDALLTWQDLCTSEVQNCPVGDQTITTGSQSPLITNTPTNTSIPNTSTPTATSTPRKTSTPSDREENTPRPNTSTPVPNTTTPVSSVAPATVAPTQVPGGTITLPDAGDGGSGPGVLVGLIAGIGTFGLLLVMGRVRSMRLPRYRGKP